jgi:hypothetical protein
VTGENGKARKRENRRVGANDGALPETFWDVAYTRIDNLRVEENSKPLAEHGTTWDKDQVPFNRYLTVN